MNFLKSKSWYKYFLSLFIMLGLLLNVSPAYAASNIYTLEENNEVSIYLHINDLGEAQYEIVNHTNQVIKDLVIDASILDSEEIKNTPNKLTIDRVEPGSQRLANFRLTKVQSASTDSNSPSENSVDNTSQNDVSQSTTADRENLGRTGEGFNILNITLSILLISTSIVLVVFAAKRKKSKNTKSLAIILALLMILTPMANLNALSRTFNFETKINLFGVNFTLKSSIIYKLETQKITEPTTKDKQDEPSETEKTNPTIPDLKETTKDTELTESTTEEDLEPTTAEIPSEETTEPTTKETTEPSSTEPTTEITTSPTTSESEVISTVDEARAKTYFELAEQSQDALYDQYWDELRGYFRREYPNKITDRGNDYWWFAHAIDTLIDGYERTGDSKYIERAEEAVKGVRRRHGSSLINDFYDDMEWMGLALVRLYDKTKNTQYLDLAKGLFKEIEGGWSEVAGGGISWQKNRRHFKNTPANAPAAILAVRLHERTDEEQYREWAHKIFNWINDTLRDPITGYIPDGINDHEDMKITWNAYTYNHGVYIGAALEMYRMTGDPKYLDYAEKTYQNAVATYSGDNGVIKEEGQDDGGLFKGILLRYVTQYYFTQNQNRPDIRNWLYTNADTAAANAINSVNLVSDKWNGPAKETDQQLSSHLSGTMLFEFAWQNSALEHSDNRYLPYAKEWTEPSNTAPTTSETTSETTATEPSETTSTSPSVETSTTTITEETTVTPEPTKVPSPTPKPSEEIVGPVEPPKELPLHGWDIYRNLDKLPELDNGSQTLEFSSFDRTGGNWSDGFDGKFSFLRQTDQGYVIAEAKGSGEIQSMWFTRDNGDVTKTGNIIIELDGKVVLNTSLQDLVNGKLGEPFVYPFVANAKESSGGVTIKVPMPYRESMKVICTNNPTFYHVSYRKFVTSDGVATFDPSYVPEDIMLASKEWGKKDPKPQHPNATKNETDFSLKNGETLALSEINGSGYINEISVNIPQFEGVPPTVTVNDDGRAYKGKSSFDVEINPNNDGVILIRRYDSFSTNQKAKILVDGKHVADWRGMGSTPGVWIEEAIKLPASATKGKSKIHIENIFVSAGIDFCEFRFFVDSIVDGKNIRTDELDVGNSEKARASEKAHNYAIVDENWAGDRTYDMPTKDTKVLEKVTDDGRAHKGTSEFIVKIDPKNKGVKLTRRYDSFSTNQKAKIFVDGKEAAEWVGSPATHGVWIEEVVYIPAEFTEGKSEIKIANKFISAGIDFAEFSYFVDSIIDGENVRTDIMDVANRQSEADHKYTLDVSSWQGERTNFLPEHSLGELDNIEITDILLEKVKVRITIDGKIRVNTPLGEFFGSAMGENNVSALMFKMDPEGEYSSWWPMPYSNSAKIELVNESEYSIGDSKFRIVYASDESVAERLTKPYPDLGYFETISKRSSAMLGQDWQAFNIKGSGKFMGIVHAMHGNLATGNTRAYLEGDERFYADGVRTPIWHGTGTEDFYEGGWYFNNGVFSNPMNGQVSYRASGKYAPYIESDAAYRLLIGDAIPYQRELTVGFEPGGFSEHNVIYSATSFFYSHQDKTALVMSDRIVVGDVESESNHDYKGAGEIRKLNSAFEGNFDDVKIEETIRYTAEPISFTINVHKDNHGIRLVRMSDQAKPYQSAVVKINGEIVGTWLQPLGNTEYRWLEDSFDIPATVSNGQKTLHVEIIPETDSNAWSAARYDIYGKLPIAMTDGDSLIVNEPEKDIEPELRVLSIGNSFSTDAQRWLNALSKAYGHEIESYNLFIGGAPLDKHLDNFRNANKAYLLERNGYPAKNETSIQEALAIADFDIITIQQVSGLSGKLETFKPYIYELVQSIRKLQPDAEIIFHQTWAYDDDSNHWDFPRYNKDRINMYNQIQAASQAIADELDIRLIKVGEVIHRLRESKYFATKGSHQISYSPYDKEMKFPEWTMDVNNPPSMTRDGYHLNAYYGRYVAAATWYATLMNQKVSGNDWKPQEPFQYPANQKLSAETWEFIRNTVDDVVFE